MRAAWRGIPDDVRERDRRAPMVCIVGEIDDVTLPHSGTASPPFAKSSSARGSRTLVIRGYRPRTATTPSHHPSLLFPFCPLLNFYGTLRPVLSRNSPSSSPRPSRNRYSTLVILSIKAVNTLTACFVLLAARSRASWHFDRDESRVFLETLRRGSVGRRSFEVLAT